MSDLCHLSVHTTVHIFSCPSNPTTLSGEDVWLDPVEVAQFLNKEKLTLGVFFCTGSPEKAKSEGVLHYSPTRTKNRNGAETSSGRDTSPGCLGPACSDVDPMSKHLLLL